MCSIQVKSPQNPHFLKYIFYLSNIYTQHFELKMLIVKAYAKFHCLNHDKNLAPIFFLFIHSNITYIITDNLIVAAIFEVYVLLLLFLAL